MDSHNTRPAISRGKNNTGHPSYAAETLKCGIVNDDQDGSNTTGIIRVKLKEHAR